MYNINGGEKWIKQGRLVETILEGDKKESCSNDIALELTWYSITTR
jgi:hypothetical protein